LIRLLSVIGASHKRAARHFPETHLQGFLAPLLKLFRRNKTLHTQMFRRRLKVLAEGEDAATRVKKIPQNLHNLFGLLPKSEHEP